MKRWSQCFVRNACFASVIILGFGLASVSQAQQGCNAYMYGIHMFDSSLQDMNDVMGLLSYQGQPRGWVLVLAKMSDYYGHTDQSVVNAAQAGFGVLVRINWDYDPNGTLPPQSQYSTFASRASQYIQNHISYCKFYQIGNECNLCSEWPSGGAGDGRCSPNCSSVREWITASRYSSAFQAVYNAIPSGIRPQVKLCLDATAVWAGQFRCPGNEFDTDDFLCMAQQYYNNVPAYMIGGLCYHPKTWHHEKWQTTNTDNWDGSPFGCSQNRTCKKYFHVFETLLGDIPTGLRDRAIFFTELNPHNYGWSDVNNEYVKQAYTECVNWNTTHTDRKITAMMLYRWKDSVPMWGFSQHSNMHNDIRAAVAQGQTSNGLTICSGGPTPTFTRTPTRTPTAAPPPGDLLSQGKPCVASSEYDGNNAAGKAVDGYIDGSHKWTSQQQSPTWWYVDLQAQKTLQQIRVYSCGAGGEASYFNLKAFTVRGSNTASGTPADWATLATYDSGGAEGANTVIMNLSGNYRYVGLHVTNSGIDNYTRVHEVRVYGTAGATPTNTPSNQVAAENFEGMPTWSSSHDGSWGSAASWAIQSGGQSGNYLQISRASQGSSAKVSVYTVPTNTNITVSAYMRCPSFAGTYWMEFGCKLGNNTAADFNENSSTWTIIKKFDSSANGNGNTWTQYSSVVSTGASTQISIGYKLGSSGGAGPTVGFDTLRITSGGTSTNLAINAVTYIASGQFSTSYRGRNAVDGAITMNGRWVTQNDATENTLVLDLGSVCSITGYKHYHSSYLSANDYIYNHKTFYVETGDSLHGPWTQRWYYNNPSQNEHVSVYNHTAVSARYVRLRITNSGIDYYVRLPEFEVYGTAGTPGTIRFEVEDYEGGRQAAQNVEYYDTGTGNTGGQYRSQDVDIETCSEGGWNVGWIYNGEWLLFPFKAPAAGSYQVRIRYAGTGNGTCRVDINDVDKTGSISLPATGGWQTWTTKTGPTISVSAGFQWVKFRMTSSGYNVNYFEFVPQ